MKTTLHISDSVMTELKQRAAKEKTTISMLVESALRLLLHSKKEKEKLPPLPTFKGGGSFVDIANREALYQLMEDK